MIFISRYHFCLTSVSASLSPYPGLTFVAPANPRLKKLLSFVLQSTKSKKLIKFSPHLRKKSRSKDNAVKDMDSGGAARDHGDRLPNGLNDKEKQGQCTV